MTQHQAMRVAEPDLLRLEPRCLLTPADVAEITGLSIETLAQWRSQKKGIPFVKISRNCVRYRQADLDVWVSERIVRTHGGRDGRGGSY
jgi:hypothetical protein